MSKKIYIPAFKRQQLMMFEYKIWEHDQDIKQTDLKLKEKGNGMTLILSKMYLIAWVQDITAYSYFMQNTYVLRSSFLKYKSMMRKSPKSMASSALNMIIAAPADIMNCLCLPENHPSKARSTEIRNYKVWKISKSNIS